MARRLRLLPLVAATYFMVSGGPYGLEDIVGQAGYGRALLLLCIVPLFWSLPTALMIGELASALPDEGGFYVWVSRALGRFWGFQEGWLSLAASVFDMAIYPALTVAYLSQLDPALTAGRRGYAIALAIVLVCVAWNLRGAWSVGRGSLWMLGLLLLPFLGIVVLGIASASAHRQMAASLASPMHGSLGVAWLFVLWNTMGWDNASTIAREVEDPQRNYIRAMLAALVVVVLSYTVPIAVVACAGVPAAKFVTGSWVEAGRLLAARFVAANIAQGFSVTIVAGGALTGVAMFNALTLSYARVPAAMARDGLLPRVLARHNRNGVPWVAVLVCGAAWAVTLRLQLTRLLELDILLYGLSLILEFIALVALRLRHPHLHRPYRVPGNTFAAAMLGVAPAAIVLYTIWAARGDRLSSGFPALALGALVVCAGIVAYPFTRKAQPRDTAKQRDTEG